ncbi:Pyrogallol hydroxytransferase large subunit [Georgfuchsia toluolica]|uniref:Pyrogallol hydroxytransferase large subunit n=1 Tax=Georgfuchsia toluolica TaxID=424218 RepID=A0A916J243_9PROT|nr:molybdopterin-dependent oxidoreductase [Georgfuchsia toluolica]CAG4882747.1 Pyrogallol hydroxytransferase large subunit [Georgfuchsia toluolica]
MKKMVLKTILFAIPHVLRRTANKYPEFQKEMRRYNCTVQIKLQDGSLGRYYTFSNGKVTTGAGLHAKPDVILQFRDIPIALTFLKPPMNYGDIIHAAKTMRAMVMGPNDLCVWFLQLMNKINTIGLEMGTKLPDGTVRYTTNTNGGPLFIFVKDGKIVRCTPIDFDDTDAPSWTIKARGKTFKPWRRATVNPYALALKSQVYSKDRILYPMKRVDWDPKGNRNPQNRGISGYERISWDEALDIVSAEITRQKTVHGPGAIAIQHHSHHQWGNVGYYLSALLRFGNMIGFTRINHNPDSWEGWYWGATHHFGNALRVGLPSFYGTVEDALKECEMMVFWSSDPEATSGVYGGFEGTQRRFWAKEVGIEFVHIDPYMNSTAKLFGGRWIPIKAGTDPAMAHAIMHVWLTEGLYDKDYVETRTTGFDQWAAYLLGKDDGVAKTPEWQEPETGVPAHVVRALARQWGKKKTYIAAGGLGTGFGGACRGATGSQWARTMILMMAMQGWGKPGINFGNMQMGAPVDNYHWFPGYAEGGISGDLAFTAGAINTYQRMPHVLSMNPVQQKIPRQRLPDAIVDGHCKGYMWDGSSMEAQMQAFEYPMQGYSKVHMIWRYGGAAFGTVAQSERYIKAYRHESIDCIVSQSIYMEGDTPFADIILPACTAVERYDIGETAGCQGYVHNAPAQLNHRTIVMQHKCIEPLGESKSDYQIFSDVLGRLGLGGMFTEGCSELDWCKRVFDASDLSRDITWKEFLKKGYYVVPGESEKTRDPVSMRWYAEDRMKDVPEPHPLPAQWQGQFGKGLPTQSGKIEFVANSILRGDPNNPERPPMPTYIPSWEGLQTKELVAKYPIQMISTHSRYSFHTYSDGKDSTVNDIEDHRFLVDGYYYWVMRVHPDDAARRGIGHHELIRVFNDRGAVICVADVSPQVAKGVVHTYESAAVFDPVPDPKGWADRGGCVNILTPQRPQVKGTEGMGSLSCLIEIEPWKPTMTAKEHFHA